MDAERGRKLTSLLRPLRAAAALAGVGDDSDEGTMALVVDVTGSDRADVWRAWDTEGLEQQAAAAAEAGADAHRPRFARQQDRPVGLIVGAGRRIRAVALADYEPYDRRESPQESLSLLAGQAGSLERGPGAAPMTPSAVRAAKAAGMAAGVMSLPKPRSTDGGG